MTFEGHWRSSVKSSFVRLPWFLICLLLLLCTCLLPFPKYVHTLVENPEIFILLFVLNAACSLWIRFLYVTLCTRWFKISIPLKLLTHIFASIKSFCMKLCTFVGNWYLHVRSNFGRFFLIFYQMALILPRAPIVFTPCRVLSIH